MSYIVLNQSNPEVVVKPPYIYKVFKITDTEIISRGDDNYDITIVTHRTMVEQLLTGNHLPLLI